MMKANSVYFVELPGSSSEKQRVEATEKLLHGCGAGDLINRNDKVAIKLHIGERNNATHVGPAMVRPIVAVAKQKGGLPFLTETSTLYKGQRSNAIDHLCHAFEHGFGYEQVGAPFIMADGLSGNTEIEVPIDGIIFNSVNIAREIMFADVLIAVSHPTGHPGCGLGGCLKNLGMGLASRIGKLRQHSSVKPYIDSSRCTLCRKCIQWCPEEAIVEQKDTAFIIEQKCIGCGECLSLCNFDAVRYNWGVESAELQKRVAEHSLGVIHGKEDRCLFLNFLFDMTKGCDCDGSRQEPFVPDVGILSSRDPVAADQATLDLTESHFGQNLGRKAEPRLDPTTQLAHGERIGLGSRRYRLIPL